MKRILSLFLVLVLCLSFAACDKKTDEKDPATDETTDEVVEAKAEEYTLYLGIAGESKSDADKAEVAFNANYAAVVVDKDGVIVDCAIDCYEHKIAISGGVAVAGEELLSKYEKGEDYGMKSFSGIGKEWNEQADHFASFVVGKKLAEVNTLDTADADLTSGCTINVAGFVAAVADAATDAYAVKFESETAPKAAISAVCSASGSKDAAADAEGVAAMLTNYAAVALVDGKIAAANVDTVDAKANFDQTGAVTKEADVASKKDKGDNYSMKAISGIGKEWYEQVAALESYVAGMTSADVAAIALAEGKPTDADLTAGCTIAISELVEVLAKAAK